MFDNSNQLCLLLTTRNLDGAYLSWIKYDNERELIMLLENEVHNGTKTFQFRARGFSIISANDILTICPNKDIFVTCWTKLDFQTIMIADQNSKSALKFCLM